MTTLGGLAAQQPRRGGVTLYTPTAATPRPRQVSNARQVAQPKGAVKVPATVDSRFLATPEEVAQRQAKAAQTKDAPWWQDSLGFVANVLSPLSVPVKAVTFGLEQATKHLPMEAREFLQHPAESIIGKNPVSEGFDAAVPLFNPFFGQDPEKQDADKRSFFNKIAPRSTYGSESIYSDIDVPFMTGLRNTALDIGHDPLMVVEAGPELLRGGAKATKAAAEAGEAAKGVEVATKALDNAAARATEHAVSGASDEVLSEAQKAVNDAAEALNRARSVADEAQLNAQRLQKAAETRQAAPRTARSRATFISELLDETPELARLQPEFQKGISKGFTAMNEEARNAVGMVERGLKLRGMEGTLPGTKRIAELGDKLMSEPLRTGFTKIGEHLPESMRNLRIPEGIQEAYRVMRSKSATPEDMGIQAGKLKMYNDMKIGGGQMKFGSSDIINRTWRKIRDLTDAQKDDLVRQAHVPGQMNELNEATKAIADHYATVTGHNIEDFSRFGADEYFPDIQTKEWGQYLAENPTDPAVIAYRGDTGFRTADRLYTSHNIDRSRKLYVPPGQAEAEIEIAGQKVTLRGNSPQDKNEALRQAFPNFKGDFYETKPDVILKRYADSLERDAATRYAVRELGKSNSPYKKVISDQLLEDLDKINGAYLGQHEWERLLQFQAQGPFRPGENRGVPPKAPLVPGSAEDKAVQQTWKDYWNGYSQAAQSSDPTRAAVYSQQIENVPPPRTGGSLVPDVGGQGPMPDHQWFQFDDGTAIQIPNQNLTLGPVGDVSAENAALFSNVRSNVLSEDLARRAAADEPLTFAGQMSAEAKQDVATVRSTLESMRDNAYADLGTNAKEAGERLKVLREARDDYLKQIKGMGKIGKSDVGKVTQLRLTVEKNISDLRDAIAKREKLGAGRLSRAERKIDQELREELRTLVAARDDLAQRIKNLPTELREEITYRTEQLTKPLADAQAELEREGIRFDNTHTKPRYTDKEIEAARRKVAEGQYAGPSADVEQYRQQYRDAVAEAEDIRAKLEGDLPGPERRKLRAKLTKAEAAADQAKYAHAEARGIFTGKAPTAAAATGAAEEAAKAVVDSPALKRAKNIVARADKWAADRAEYLKQFEDKVAAAREKIAQHPEAIVRSPDGTVRYIGEDLGRGVTPEIEPGVQRIMDRGMMRQDVGDIARQQQQTMGRREAQQVFGQPPPSREIGGRVIEPITTPPQPGATVTDAPTIYTAPVTGEVRQAPPGVQVPPQRTEQEAIGSLKAMQQGGDAASADLNRQLAGAQEDLATARQTLPTREAEQKAAAAAQINAETAKDLDPMQQKLLANQLNLPGLQGAEGTMAAAATEAAWRKQLNETKKLYDSLPFGKRKADLKMIIDDMEKIDAINPLLDPATRQSNQVIYDQFSQMLARSKQNIDVANMFGKMARDARAGKMPDVLQASVGDAWWAIHNGPLQAGDVLVDQRLRKFMLDVVENTKDPNALGRLLNKVTDIFKTYATLSPQFHARNAMSGIFMNAADGVTLANQLEGWRLAKAFKSNGVEWLRAQSPEVREAFSAAAASGAGGRFAERGFAGVGDEALKSITRNRFTLASQRLGERVELSLRLSMALDSVKKGMTQAETLERLRFIHFDYAEVSKMDRTMRQLVPFWTFTSRNLPMQLQMVYTQPAMYSAYQNVQRNTGAPNAPFTPDYWSRTGAWNTGLAPGGNPLYINPGLGFNQAATQLQEIQDALKGDWGGLVSEANPMLLAPLEFLGKKDMFRDRNFGPADYSKAGGPLGTLIGALATVVPGQDKNVGGEKLVADNFMNLLTSIIPPLNQLQRMAPQSVGELSDADRQVEALLRYIGVPIRTLSPKMQQQTKESKFYDVLDERNVTKKLMRRAAA